VSCILPCFVFLVGSLYHSCLIRGDRLKSENDKGMSQSHKFCLTIFVAFTVVYHTLASDPFKSCLLLCHPPFTFKVEIVAGLYLQVSVQSHNHLRNNMQVFTLALSIFVALGGCQAKVFGSFYECEQSGLQLFKC